jgi:hypothetical protein
VLLQLGAVSVPVVEAPISVEAAMAAGAGPIERAAERVARLLDLPKRRVPGNDRIDTGPDFDEPVEGVGGR